MDYQLIYWPFLPGRGEFVRLVLEECAVAYDDVARRAGPDGSGLALVQRYMSGEEGVVFAPPVLVRGDFVLSQTAAICAHLGRRLGLAPQDERPRLRALELMLTVMDVVDEFHHLHHPVAPELTYEAQKETAIQASRIYREERLARRLGFFERVLTANDGDYLAGDALTYVDLALFQLLEGVAYALPNALARIASAMPRLCALRDNVRARPRIEAYLSSERRMAFNEMGIFRHYQELDDPR
ncbi:MAG: glutathione S-transferase [Myxococcota bacterium]